MLVLLPIVPESARFYLVKGKKESAKRVLSLVARLNSKSLPEGKVVLSYENKHVHPEAESQDYCVTNSEILTINRSINGGCGGDEYKPLLVKREQKKHPYSTPLESNTFIHKLSLLSLNGKWLVTALLILLWLGAAMLYFGNILLTSTIFEYNPHCGANGTASITTNYSNCRDEELDTTDYLNLMWTAAAEIPGILVTVIIIEVIGRKLTMAFNLIL